MLQQYKERQREFIVLLAFVLGLGGLSIYAHFIEGARLSELAQERAVEIELLRERDIRLSAVSEALKAELEQLKIDSEETSLVARTMFGMISADEVIYQLNADQYQE